MLTKHWLSHKGSDSPESLSSGNCSYPYIPQNTEPENEAGIPFVILISSF
jgi:hypothetical protein